MHITYVFTLRTRIDQINRAIYITFYFLIRNFGPLLNTVTKKNRVYIYTSIIAAQRIKTLKTHTHIYNTQVKTRQQDTFESCS